MSYLQTNVKQEAPARHSIDKNSITQVSASNNEVAPFVDQFPAIPAEMKQRDQWIVFTLSKPDADGKQNKIPCHPANGRAWNEFDTAVWMSYKTALRAWKRNPRRFRGIGYVFIKDDPFAGIDLDNCFHNGTLDDRAAGIVTALNSYTEISLSGKGVKTIVRADVAHNPRCVPGIEIYGHDRFFALTGKHLEGMPLTISDASAALQEIIQRYQVEKAKAAPASVAFSGNITDKPWEEANARICVLDVLDEYGSKGKSGLKNYHCPCGAHRGKSASLMVYPSKKYPGRVVIQGTNPGCVFHGKPHHAYDAIVLLGYAGNETAANRAIRDRLNMPIQREPRTFKYEPKAPAPAAVRVVVNPDEVMNSVLLKMAKDETLKKSERRVLNALVDHADNGVTQLTVKQLMGLTKQSDASIRRATRTLNNRYFVKTEDANDIGGNVANVYTFIKVKEMTAPPAAAVKTDVSGQKTENDSPFLDLKERKGGANPASAATPADHDAPIIDSTWPAVPASVAIIPPLSFPPSEASAELLNVANDLLTDEKFAEYELLKSQYPQLTFATDERYCYRNYKNANAPRDSGGATSDSALADTPISQLTATVNPQNTPQAAQDERTALIDTILTDDAGEITASFEPIPDGFYLNDVGEIQPMLQPGEWRYNESPSRAQWRIAEREYRDAGHAETVIEPSEPRRRYRGPVVSSGEQDFMRFDAGEAEPGANALAAFIQAQERQAKRCFATKAPAAGHRLMNNVKQLRETLQAMSA